MPLFQGTSAHFARARQRTTLCSPDRISQFLTKCKQNFYKKVVFPHLSRRDNPAAAAAAGKSHKLPPLHHIQTHKKPASAAPITVPKTRQILSPATGPDSQQANKCNALPPSSGRTGSRLNAPRVRCAPIAVSHFPFPSQRPSPAHRRFIPGPASTTSSSLA